MHATDGEPVARQALTITPRADISLDALSQHAAKLSQHVEGALSRSLGGAVAGMDEQFAALSDMFDPFGNSTPAPAPAPRGTRLV